MQKRLAALAVAIVSIAVMATVMATVFVSPPPQTRSAAVTWGLLAEIVYRLGGGGIEVHQLLPVGAELHDWEPTPEAVSVVGRSSLLIYTMRGLDGWAAKLAEATGVRAFEASQNIFTSSSGPDGGYALVDPHIWLSPRNMVKIVEGVADELVKTFPELRDSIMSNAKAMVSELEDLDRRIEERLRPYVGRLFITQHDSFRYFASSYGLRTVGILGPEEREPTSSELAEIYRLIKDEGIRVIYAEDGVIYPILEAISKDTGVKILMLYTAEGMALDDVRNGVGYTALMMRNVEALAEGFELE